MKGRKLGASLLIVSLLISMPILSLALSAQGHVDAGPDQRVYVDQTVHFDGNVYPKNASIITVKWDFNDGSSPVNGSDPTLLKTTTHTYTTVGVYNVTLIVKLNSNYNVTESDIVIIRVVQNLPPIADAGPDQIVEATSPAGAEVTLDGSGSSDPYNDSLTYNWKWNGGSASGVIATATFPLGTTSVTLTVNDGQYNDTDVVSIKVVDTTPPEITVSVAPNDLWPPNHKYVEVTSVVAVHDIVDPSPTINIISITSNEPDNANGIGDGNTINDIVIIGNFVLEIRAERAGTGLGRTYTIIYRATDFSGNYAEASTTVTVKHN